MRRSASRALSLAALSGIWWIPGLVSAATYPGNDTDPWGGPETQLSSAQIANDGSNIYFTIKKCSI